MNWYWVIGITIYLFVCFWGWAIVRTGALADRRAEEDDKGA